MKVIFLTQNKTSLVDDDDFVKFGHLKWCAALKKSSGKYYAIRTETATGRRNVRLSRLIMNAPKGMVVDHINHDTLDNRKSNLRVVSNAENCMNRPGASVRSTSGIRGVSYHKRVKKWAANIRVNWKLKHLGYYPDKHSARAAREAAGIKYFGAYAGGL